MLGNNIYIKAAGEELWPFVINRMKENRVWDSVIWESSSISADIQSKYILENRDLLPKNRDEYSREILLLKQKMLPNIYKFIDFSCRLNSFDQNHYSIAPFHRFENLFHLLIEVYATLFLRNKINAILVNRAYHTGADYIAYEVAKLLNIKTIILENAYFYKGRFFCYFKNSDFGLFETVQYLSDDWELEKIQKGYKKTLPYMKSFYNKQRSIKGRVFNSDFVDFTVKLLKGKTLIEPYYQLALDKEFKKNNARNSVNRLDLSSIDYVYFPFHLQPEKTTSNWGGVYRDQLYALEQLQLILPNGWKILVKENPKQRGFMRDGLFYERLNNIEDVILVERTFDTYELMKHCKIVATITGTAGWEAITGGKNVVVFGFGVWYKTFPGVYNFGLELDLELISKNVIDFSEIERKYNSLKAYTYSGQVYGLHGKYSIKEDMIRNANKVADSLMLALYGIKVNSNYVS